MAKGAGIPDWRILDFFCDDAGSCALTALVHGFRFHVIVDKDELEARSNLRRKYEDLVDQHRSGASVQPSSTKSADHDAETDSGIDVNDATRSHGQQELDPTEALQRFMLEPLADELNKLSETEEEESLQEWYNGPTYYYNIVPSRDGDGMSAIQLEATDDLTKRMAKLKPELILAKAMTDKSDLPVYRASALTVISTSDQPPGTPHHPCRVRHRSSGEESFLKVVDNAQPQPMKRELSTLHKATDLKLNRQIRVPALRGLVAFDDAEPTKSGQRRIMGFLQTDIPGAKPLTGMLDPAVDGAKRERWAREADRAKEVLHRHDIVWGDAKADNFVVDADDGLWIIDFGGSYTEGWVDAEIQETVEGDDMGTEKIVNALRDPVANTFDPEEGEGEAEAEGRREEDGKPSVTFSPDEERKRKARASEDSEADHDDAGKGGRRKALRER